jgi:hypothetical protein
LKEVSWLPINRVGWRVQIRSFGTAGALAEGGCYSGVEAD